MQIIEDNIFKYSKYQFCILLLFKIIFDLKNENKL